MSPYLKVSRLLPGDDDEIRIIKDGTGEMDLSNPGKAVKFVIGGVLFLAIRSQIVGMINEWPRRTAGLWGVVEKYRIFEK